MKIRELVSRTGVPKQTIHYYLQKGLLPKPRKLGSNSAEYNQAHVERIRLIKELQENYYLPLAVIKKILAKYGRQTEDLTQLKIKAEYFKPVDQLLTGHIRGEKAFLERTGLAPERLAQYEEWGIITPKEENGKKVYSHEDHILGKLIAQYRAIGMTKELGFEPDILKDLVETFRGVVAGGRDDFFKAARSSLTPDEIREIFPLATEITASFYYNLYLKLNKEMSADYFTANEDDVV